jgi:hypothetical protein
VVARLAQLATEAMAEDASEASGSEVLSACLTMALRAVRVCYEAGIPSEVLLKGIDPIIRACTGTGKVN